MTQFSLNKSMFLDPRAVPASAWLGHIPLAGWIVEAARPRMLVELGTHLGASYFALCQAVQESGLDTRCYAVDTWQGDEHAGQYGEEVFNSVADHHRNNYEGFSKLIRMTFDEACRYFDDNSIDLLHIDGLHTYDAVRHDFETWLPKMSSRGVILLHDTNVRERDFGVWKLWSELRDRYPSFEFSHTHGLGVLLVGTEPPEALQAFIAAAGAAKGDEVNRLFERLGLLIATRQRLDDLARHQVRVEGDNRHLRDVLAEREAALEQMQNAIAQLQALLHGQESRTAGLEAELIRSRATLDEREAELAQSRHELGERDAALAESRHALSEREASLASAITGAAQEAAMRERMQIERVALTERVATAEERRAGAEDAEAALASHVARLENELSEASASLASQLDETRRLARDLAATRAKLSKILGSSAWRVTAPMRKLESLLRGERSGTVE
ncbi:MAG: class I SAM-dependent methyltransferase [Lysobacter sp.]